MTEAGGRARRIRIAWAVRLAVSAAVLGIIFAVLPLRDVVDAMRRISPGQWVAVLAVFLVGHVISAQKWQLLANSGASFAAVLRAHFGGLVANLCLPGVAGGDVVRAGLLYPQVTDKPRLVLGSLADRAVDTVGLLIIAAGALVVALREVGTRQGLLIGVVAALVGIGVAMVATVKLLPRLIGRLPAAGRLRRMGEQVLVAGRGLARQPGRLVVCLVLSILVQASFIAANVELAEAAGVHVPAAAWFFAWPLAKLIATVPISIAGLGVREASLAALLAPFGASPAAVVAIGLLWQSVQIAGGLIGGLIVVTAGGARGTRRDPAPDASASGDSSLRRPAPPAP